MMPVISVIVPVYNDEKHITEALHSCIWQTYGDREVIVINDGSTDDSLAKINGFINEHSDDDIRVITTDNRGLSAARNEGIRQAKGKYICFLDSDDLLRFDAMEECVICMENHNLDMVTFDSFSFADDEYREFESILKQSIRIDKMLHRRILTGREFTLSERMAGGIHVAAWQSVYSREFLHKNNIWFSEGLLFEDNAFHFRCLYYANRLMYLPKILYEHRIRHGSIMTTEVSIHKINSVFGIMNDICSFLEENERRSNPLEDQWIKYANYIFCGLINMIEDQLNYRNYSKAIESQQELSHKISGIVQRFLGLACACMCDDTPFLITGRMLCKLSNCFDICTEEMMALQENFREAFVSGRIKNIDAFYEHDIKVGLYGCGKYAEFLMKNIERIREERSDFFNGSYVFLDTNAESHESSFLGYDVINIRDAIGEGVDVIVIFSAIHKEELIGYSKAFALGIPVYEMGGRHPHKGIGSRQDFYYPQLRNTPLDNKEIFSDVFFEKLSRYAKENNTKKRILLLSTPNHDNVGDYMITMAEKIFFEKNFPKYELVVIDENLLISEFDKTHIRLDDVVVVTGGGFVGEWDHRHNVEHILMQCRRNKIVFFPQSVFFGGEDSIKRLQVTNELFSRCCDVTFIAREKNTFEFINNFFPSNVHKALIPDIALSLEPFEFKRNRCGAAVFLRDDFEACISKGTKKRIISLLSKSFAEVSISSMHLGRKIKNSEEKSAVCEKLSEISGYKLVVTDQLHCMIACFLTGTPCLAIDNTTGKIGGVYDWIRNTQYIRFCENWKDLIEVLQNENMFGVYRETIKFDYSKYYSDLRSYINYDE